MMNLNRNRMLKGLVSAMVVLLCGEVARAELSLASPFTDHAVLQRNQGVPVWGASDAGAEVRVEFAGQSVTGVADEAGAWQVKLEPLEGSSEGRLLTAKSSTGDRVDLKDVVVGEVWLCSGQSNMVMGWSGIPEMRPLERKSKHLRTFEVKQMVALTEQNRLQGEWKEESPSSAVALSFAHFLQQEAEVPVGVILAAWGSSSLEAWMPRSLTEEVPHFKTMMEEFDADEETRQRIESILAKQPWSRQDDIFLRRQTNVLYNAMIHPLIPYACQGVVWYQGERNTQSMHGMLKEPWFSRNSGMIKYGETLKHWMSCYRERWGDEELDFLVVMLPGYHKSRNSGLENEPEHAAAQSWAWMRESQLMALELPHAAVVNTIDLGDVKNIHPKDKLPVGRRAALLAASEVLGKEVVARGPMVKEVKKEGEGFVVSFDNAKGLKTNDGKAPTGFWVSDTTMKWVKAKAEIRGEEVVLTTAEFVKPLYVRYAFAGKPAVNLVNESGLPAYPFRTDTFEP